MKPETKQTTKFLAAVAAAEVQARCVGLQQSSAPSEAGLTFGL
jgi:hypothetical protein